MKKSHYSVVIQWSPEDQVYVVTLPEWGAHTHGETYEEAARNAQEVLDMLMETEAEDGRTLPAPHGFMFPGPSGFTYEFQQSNGSTHSAPKKKVTPKLRGSAKSFRRASI